MISNQKLMLHQDYFPMPYAATGKQDITVNQHKTGILFLHDLLDSNRGNPHFELKEALIDKCKEAEKNGISVFFILDTAAVNEKYDLKDKTPAVSIPVFYLTASGTQKYLHAKNNAERISYSIQTETKITYGHNVVGFINNNADYTIILGAHYDHLGYGQDHNSLYTGTVPMIHNGADDNASGVAALIGLGKWIKDTGLKKYNYALVAFSGEELGLYGSKYFTEHCPIGIKTINYMINMDMVGRLNDSTHGISIGGYGTSPVLGELIKKQDAYASIKTDSSGIGPSDHTSFYTKDIPVLFFFTGSHADYHKPSDDADKINCNGELAVIKYIKKILVATDKKEKLAFTKTKDISPGRGGFKVSLGIMPDYTFSGNGVRVDGVSEGRPAKKAGIKTGDVLYQLGDHSFSDVETYMQALNKFNKGEAAKVKFKRGNDDMEVDVVF